MSAGRRGGSCAAAEKTAIVDEAAGVLGRMEQNAGGQSALFSLLGHKGDLMLVHFRRSFDELNLAELQLAQLRLSDFLEPTTSYLSVIELGLYESTIKAYRDLKDRGIEAHSEEWKREIAEVLARQTDAMRPRLVSGDAETSLRFVLSHGPAAGREPRTGMPCPLKSGRGR